MSRKINDEQLSLKAIKSGDRNEFARMVDAHYELIYKLALRMMKNPQDAEDVLQETFIKAYKHINNFDGRSSLSTWLYRIATNEALMILRRKQPELVSIEVPSEDEQSEQEPLEIFDWCCMPEETLMSSEARAHLDEAVKQLPASLRVVFILRDIQGLSTRETSQVLEISEMAVKTRLSRARLRLREDLSGYFAEHISDVQGSEIR